MKRLSARLAVTLLTVLRVAALKADDCCDRCGCAVCRRVARVVREMKKVAVTVYTYESCDAGAAAGQPCGEKCTCQDAHDPCGPSSAIPLDPDHVIHSRLVEHTHYKEIPTYKWVVEYLCEDCASQSETARMDDPSPRSRQQWDSLGLIADWSAARGCSAEKTHYLIHN